MPTRFARRIHIAASPAEVWAALVDVEAWPAWASQFKRLERLDQGPLTAGSRVRVRPNGMTGSVWSVIEYDPGRAFTWESALVPGLRVTAGHELTPDATGTVAEFWLEAGGALGTLLSPLLRATVFSRNTRNATTGLKSLIERRGLASEP